MKNCAVLFGLVLCSGALSASGTNDWENLAVNSINRLPARSYSVPLASEKDALTDALEPASPYRKSLNGTWKFSWSGDPALRVKDFWQSDFDDSKWFDITVPGCVERQGYGVPIYANSDYPFEKKFPLIRDSITGEANYNPVSSYRTSFTIPVEWKDRRIILRFEGVYSAYYVWVNGKKVGYAEDSCLPSEFDVTPYLNSSSQSNNQTIEQSTNVLAVEVYRWCDGSYLEDQDMTRYSGIYRDVELLAMPKNGIWDFKVTTTPVEGYSRWRLEVEVEKQVKVRGEGEQRIEVSIYDDDQKRICDLQCQPQPSATTSSPSPLTFTSTLAAQAWSAEDPYLYTLVLRKGDDIRMKRIGFKEQRIDGHRVLVNGMPIKFKGVNRHEASVDGGRTVTVDDMIRDIELMKRYNINTVRTCHYPDHRLWYDLCDRYGLYVVAEANVEGHGYWFGEEGLGCQPEFEHSIVERNERQVVFYRNDPCVVFWSMGNETGPGDNFKKAMDAVRKLDPARFVHFERQNRDADIDSTMYPFVDWLEKRGQAGDGLAEAPEVEWEIRHKTGNVQTKNKPYFSCEYAHAMGNAMGNFKEYWDVFYAHESLSGGCIWDWADQAVWKETERIDPATGRRERYLAYGADYDEPIKAGNFNCNGVVDALRNVSPKLIEVAHVYRNLVVRMVGDGFELENRFCFTNADRFDGQWELLSDGEVVARDVFKVPSVAPLTKVTMKFRELDVAMAAARTAAVGRNVPPELLVNFSFKMRDDTRWAKNGWIVARDQVALSKPSCATREVRPAKLRLTESYDSVTVDVADTKAVFSRASGTLSKLVMNGVTVLEDGAPGLTAGPRLTCARAFTDNDIRMRDGASWSNVPEEKLGFYGSGLSQLRYHARPIEILPGGVRTEVEVLCAKSAGYTHIATWSFAEDGSITVDETMTPHGRFPKWLPRLGLTLRLDPALEKMRYYGRGPWENYIDRSSASFLGIYTGMVREQFVDYVRPQDNGGKCDVRWVEFTNDGGNGVRFSASQPLFIQALHYSWEDLEFARHRGGETRFRSPLVPHPETFLNLDVRQYGLGGNSCGPTTLPQYEFNPNESVTWKLRIAPVEAMSK